MVQHRRRLRGPARALILGNFLQKLSGFRAVDSRALIGVLQAHVERPENTVGRRWRAGDVAIWDNRATQTTESLLAPESVPEPGHGIASGASTDGAVAESAEA